MEAEIVCLPEYGLKRSLPSTGDLNRWVSGQSDRRRQVMKMEHILHGDAILGDQLKL